MARKKTEKQEETQATQAVQPLQTAQTQTQAKPLTKKEKTAAAKTLILDALKEGEAKSNELIDRAAALYTERFAGEETENANDVKGRIGSVLDVMKKENEVSFEGGVYALKAKEDVEKPKKSTRAKKPTQTREEVKTEEPTKRGRKKKTEEETQGKEEVKTEEPKKRGRKKKTPVEEIAQMPVEEPKTEKNEEKEQAKEKEERQESQERQESKESKEQNPPRQLVVKEKAEVVKKDVVDMSFLFGSVKPKTQPKAEIKTETKTEKTPVAKTETPVQAIPAPVKTEEKQEKQEKAVVPAPVQKTVAAQEKQAQEKSAQTQTEKKAETPKNERSKTLASNVRGKGKNVVTAKAKEKTADEKLRDAFIDRLHKLGGTYFEYYSVYLLEKYSRKNGRRLEGLRVSGGDRDGGIDGEIELTDRMGFRETIYIQAKNWSVDGTNKSMKMVGETVLQQFLGACLWRQTQEGKQNCRGIFMTLTQFTPESKRLLDEMSDKLVGYDATDIFETAKECEFGLVKKNGEWVLDENLLSGEKAFFFMF